MQWFPWAAIAADCSIIMVMSFSLRDEIHLVDTAYVISHLWEFVTPGFYPCKLNIMSLKLVQCKSWVELAISSVIPSRPQGCTALICYINRDTLKKKKKSGCYDRGCNSYIFAQIPKEIGFGRNNFLLGLLRETNWLYPVYSLFKTYIATYITLAN